MLAATASGSTSKRRSEPSYLIGSLHRNPQTPCTGAAKWVANQMRDAGLVVFDDWWSAGPDADDCWQAHERAPKGRSYVEALYGRPRPCVFEFD
jgi:hypothetical protein